MNLNKPITNAAIIGFGKTGKAVLDFFLNAQKNHSFPPGLRAKQVFLFNDSPVEDNLLKPYIQKGVTFLCGEKNFNQMGNMDLIVLSPGVNGLTPRFDNLRSKGIAIISEIELAALCINAPIIAITGTNGKSTTVSLIHHILLKGGIKSFLTGNIGLPLIAEVDKITDNSVVVLEVSSFQLEEIASFRPHIGLILNITPDHLDRYPDMDAYVKAKLNLVKNQKDNDFLILNLDDPLLREMGKSPAQPFGLGRIVWFSRENADPGLIFGKNRSQPFWNARLVDNDIWLRCGDINEKISLGHNPLRGLHNLENLLAAISASRLQGVPATIIETAIADFKGLSHRMELAGKIGNVEFINDSKATNVDAALKSITSIAPPQVLILGGKDKGGNFKLLVNAIKERVNKVLLVGYAAKTIHNQLIDSPDGRLLEAKLEHVTDFPEAILKGYRYLEKTGGVVLLAPACASFDMFNNFEHRGDVFRQEVQNLANILQGPGAAFPKEPLAGGD